MPYTCKHYTVPTIPRNCTECGQVFWICPKCAKWMIYAWLCEDCEKEARQRAAIRKMGTAKRDYVERT